MAEGTLVPRLSLVFSVIALGGASAALATNLRARRSVASSAAVPEPDLDELERRMTGLERRLELVRVGAAVRAAAPAQGTTEAPPAAAPEVAGLAQRVAQLEQLAAEVVARKRQGQGGHPLSPEELAAATGKVLDRQASVQERAAALTLLRPNDGRADGRTHEVVVAALELLDKPDVAPKVRAGMIRDLDWVSDPSLKGPLVGILSRDPDGRTRREAVETLAVFYDDPQVRALVERLRDSDPEPQVRDQATKQLGRWRSRAGQ